MIKNKFFVPAITLFSCIIMLIVDGIITPPYIIKSIIKVICFFIIPFCYLLITKNKELIEKFKYNKKSLLISLALGIGVFLIIICGYFLVGMFFDFSNTGNYIVQSGIVNKESFIYRALYIMIVNSFLEEFFFRGFTFICSKKYFNRIFAYIFSALAFSFYHVAMMINWFQIWVFILIILALAVAGAIFDFLCERYNIYVSWTVHFFANFAINLIGLHLINIAV